VILGARTEDQLRKNLQAADLHLSDKEAEILNSASDPGAADYPYGGPGTEQRSRKVQGGR
jgi:aryl-alcohol dehydrogenase (NADP+)